MSHTFLLANSKYTPLKEYCLQNEEIFPQAVFQDWVQGMVEAEETEKHMFERRREWEARGEFVNDPLFRLAGSLSQSFLVQTNLRRFHVPKKTDLFVDTSGWACYFDSKDEFHANFTPVPRSIHDRRR